MSIPSTTHTSHLNIHSPMASLSIDLHGMSVEKAKQYVDKTIAEALEKKVDNLTIVTGIGNHINNNGTRAVLFKALPTWLENPTFRASITEVKQDMGAYEIQFDGENNYSSSIKAYNQKILPIINTPQYKEMFKECEQKAQKGEAESQEILGLIYVNGIGVAEDIDKGLPLLIKAAENRIETQVLLGILFALNGFRCKDYNESKKWFLKAAEKNDLKALFYLGQMFWLGRGVIKNDRTAISYMSKGADLGCIYAAQNLANIFFSGVGTIKMDLTLAAKYHAIAAKGGLVPSQVTLAKQYFFGWGIENNDEEAYKLFHEAALKKDPAATYYVGRCYETGRGVPAINRVSAAVWYKRSALYGDLDGAFNVAYAHLTGEFYKKDIEEGIKLLSQLAEKHHANSLCVLGSTLLMDGPYRDLKRGIAAISEAAQLGEVEAQLSLARWYVKGCEFLPKNEAEAFKYFNLAAEQDDVVATTGVGYCYLNGIGIKPNRNMAKKYFEKAAEKGDAIARKNLIALLQPKNHQISFSKEAIKWLELDAQDEEVDSQFILGRTLVAPANISNNRSFQEGIYWLHKAAVNDHPGALHFFKESEKAGQTRAFQMCLSAEYQKRHGTDAYEKLSLWE